MSNLISHKRLPDANERESKKEELYFWRNETPEDKDKLRNKAFYCIKEFGQILSFSENINKAYHNVVN